MVQQLPTYENGMSVQTVGAKPAGARREIIFPADGKVIDGKVPVQTQGAVAGEQDEKKSERGGNLQLQSKDEDSQNNVMGKKESEVNETNFFSLMGRNFVLQRVFSIEQENALAKNEDVTESELIQRSINAYVSFAQRRKEDTLLDSDEPLRILASFTEKRKDLIKDIHLVTNEHPVIMKKLAEGIEEQNDEGKSQDEHIQELIDKETNMEVRGALERLKDFLTLTQYYPELQKLLSEEVKNGILLMLLKIFGNIVFTSGQSTLTESQKALSEKVLRAA